MATNPLVLPCVLALIFLAVGLAVYGYRNQRKSNVPPPILPQHQVSAQYARVSSVVVQRPYPEPRPPRFVAPQPPHKERTTPAAGSQVISSTYPPQPRTHPREFTPSPAQLPGGFSAPLSRWADVHQTIQAAGASHHQGVVTVRLERERTVRPTVEARLARLGEQARPAPKVRGQPARQGNGNTGGRRKKRRHHRDITTTVNPEASPSHEEFQTQNDSDDPVFRDLRNRAKTAKKEAQTHFKTRNAARARGDHALASILKSAGENCQKEAERLDAEASERIFEQNNRGSSPGKVDLHDLYVKEAERYASQSLERALDLGLATMTFIVGKGNHSVDGIPKIKPAIERLMRAKGYEPKSPPSNPGQLIIQLQGRPLMSRL